MESLAFVLKLFVGVNNIIVEFKGEKSMKKIIESEKEKMLSGNFCNASDKELLRESDYAKNLTLICPGLKVGAFLIT